MRIRPSRPDDRDFVLGLVPELLAFGSPPPWRDAERMRTVDRRVLEDVLDGRAPGATVLVAEDEGGERLGFVHLTEWADFYGSKSGHVGDVVVAPDARGRGVGTALLAEAEDWARERGHRILTLNVFARNESARRVYERAGFVPEVVRYAKPI